MENTRKRYRREEEEKSSESDDDYVPYVPVKERRKQQLAKLGRVNQIKQDDGQIKGKSSSENELDNDEDGQASSNFKCKIHYCTEFLSRTDTRLTIEIYNV